MVSISVGVELPLTDCLRSARLMLALAIFPAKAFLSSVEEKLPSPLALITWLNILRLGISFSV